MKNSISILAVTLSLFSTLISCDRIENPVVNNSTSLDWTLYPDSDTNTYPWPTWTQNTNTSRYVLLEDYTGHTCVNCPSAAIIAKNIEDANAGKVIVMGVHASSTNAYQLPELPEFPSDFRTEAGNEYANTMLISFNPAGMVNRVIRNGNYYVFSPNWDTETNAELVKTPDFNLQVAFNYFSATRGLFLHTETEALTTVTGDYNIINYLVRDTVVAPQKLTGGAVNEDYDHHAMLSATINGTWGTPVITGGIESGTKLYHHFSYQLPDASVDTTFNINNLSIISVISDRDNYEILQVVKTPLFE